MAELSEKQKLVAALGKLAVMFGRELSGDVLVFIADILLQHLSGSEAMQAISKWSAVKTKWPAPAELIELIKPAQTQTDHANDLALRLRRAIARRGYTWESTYRYDGHASIEDAIRAEVGEDAVAIVNRSGGWSAFCREWGGDEGDTTARAQLRGMCEAIGKTQADPHAYLGEREQARLEASSEDADGEE